MSELYEQMTDDGNDKLCENMDCERFPPDWDPEEDTEETYQEGQWKKCCLCDGYFDDDGLGDILFVQEEPNNQEAGCDLCGKENNIVQMKGSGQYLCENACDESDEEEEEESICLFNYYICRYCDYITTNDDPDCKKCKKELCMELFQAENQ